MPATVRISNRQGEEGSTPPRRGLARGLVRLSGRHTCAHFVLWMRPERRGGAGAATPRACVRPPWPTQKSATTPPLVSRRWPHSFPAPASSARHSGEERANERVVRAAGRVPGRLSRGSSAEDWGLRHCGRREEAALFSSIWGEKEGSGRHDSVGIGLKIRSCKRNQGRLFHSCGRRNGRVFVRPEHVLLFNSSVDEYFDGI